MHPSDELSAAGGFFGGAAKNKIAWLSSIVGLLSCTEHFTRHTNTF